MSSDDFKRSRGRAGAAASKMSPTRFAPYKKIMEEVEAPIGNSGYTSTVEVLECGHQLRPRHDMIGTTYPERRRCVDCLKASCAEAGHPLVDWFGPHSFNGRTHMQCRCQAVNGEE